MKKLLLFLAVCSILGLFCASCSPKPADGFDFKVAKVTGDKYFARLEVNIERQDKQPMGEFEFECSSEDADISYSSAVWHDGNTATAELDIGYVGSAMGEGDETGLNGKRIKIAFAKITVNGVEYTGNWTLEHTLNVPTASKRFFLTGGETKNDLRFSNIEAASHSIIYRAELNDLDREKTGGVKFYRKDGSAFSPISSSYSSGWEEGSRRSEISGVHEFIGELDFDDIGFAEFDGEKYELTDVEPSESA